MLPVVRPLHGEPAWGMNVTANVQFLRVLTPCIAGKKGAYYYAHTLSKKGIYISDVVVQGLASYYA